MLKRGIVISPPFEPLITGGIRCGGEPDPIELRKYLLYWDQIDYPSNNLVRISSADIDYLETTDALKRTRVAFQGQGRIYFGNGEFSSRHKKRRSERTKNSNLALGHWLNFQGFHFIAKMFPDLVLNLNYMECYQFQ